MEAEADRWALEAGSEPRDAGPSAAQAGKHRQRIWHTLILACMIHFELFFFSKSHIIIVNS